MKKAIIILFLIICKLVQATPQARDMLYWNDVTYYVLPFIDVESRLRSDELHSLNKKKTTNPPTSNYRGYWCEFEITGDTLFLISIKDSDKEDITESVFGCQDRRALLDFSDTLYLGYGASFYDYGWWTMVNESELTVVFKNGVVQWVKDNRNKSRYSRYDHDDLLFSEYIYCNTRWNELNEQTLLQKPTVLLRYDIDTLGKIAEIKVLRSSGYAEFDEEAIRVINSIPCFSVSFVKGKYISHSYDYLFSFDLERAKRMGKYSKQKQYDNQLLRIFEECITKTKAKYDGFSEQTGRNMPLYLCRDGLPSPFLEQNKPFYESIGIENISLANSNKHQKELKRGIDVIEIRYYLKGNIVEIYTHLITVTKKNKELFLAYWFEDVDKYIYEYSCKSNEWRLVSADKYYDRDSGSFASISQDSIAVVFQRKNNEYFYYGCYRMENDTMVLSENLIKRIEDTTDKEEKKGQDKGVYLVKQNEIYRRVLSPEEITIVFDRENNSLVVSLSIHKHVQTTSEFVFAGCEDSCLLLVRKRFPYLSLQLQKDNSEHQRMRQK